MILVALDRTYLIYDFTKKKTKQKMLDADERCQFDTVPFFHVCAVLIFFADVFTFLFICNTFHMSWLIIFLLFITFNNSE